MRCTTSVPCRCSIGLLREQGEEEANARDMVTNMKLFGSDPKGLFDLDREYQARVYTAQTALPM